MTEPRPSYNNPPYDNSSYNNPLLSFDLSPQSLIYIPYRTIVREILMGADVVLKEMYSMNRATTGVGADKSDRRSRLLSREQ